MCYQGGREGRQIGQGLALCCGHRDLEVQLCPGEMGCEAEVESLPCALFQEGMAWAPGSAAHSKPRKWAEDRPTSYGPWQGTPVGCIGPRCELSLVWPGPRIGLGPESVATSVAWGHTQSLSYTHWWHHLSKGGGQEAFWKTGHFKSRISGYSKVMIEFSRDGDTRLSKDFLLSCFLVSSGAGDSWGSSYPF